MNKYNRDIDSKQMNKSKEHTIDVVMNEIHTTKNVSFSWIKSFRLIPAFSLVFVIALALLLFRGEKDPTINNPTQLSNLTVTRLAEISYITANLFQVDPSTNNPVTLGTAEDETEFEGNIDVFNEYFDILKVFLDEDNAVLPNIEAYDGEQYDYILDFVVQDILYTFYILIDDEEIIGELQTQSMIFTLSGTYKESNNEVEIELDASNANNYVNMKYSSQNSVETEIKYEIESMINGVEQIKEFKISKEGQESKVEIKENENEYTLKKEIEDGQLQYKLEYSVNGQEGQVKIIESIDAQGNKTYQYNITENGKSKSIEKSNHGKSQGRNNNFKENITFNMNIL